MRDLGQRATDRLISEATSHLHSQRVQKLWGSRRLLVAHSIISPAGWLMLSRFWEHKDWSPCTDSVGGCSFHSLMLLQDSLYIYIGHHKREKLEKLRQWESLWSQKEQSWKWLAGSPVKQRRRGTKGKTVLILDACLIQAQHHIKSQETSVQKFHWPHLYTCMGLPIFKDPPKKPLKQYFTPTFSCFFFPFEFLLILCLLYFGIVTKAYW